ncbi:MAG: hypothetical protein R3E84_12770 [Pseudomonadales bacterium]
MWFHASAGAYFQKVLRDTVTYALAASCHMDESLPLPAVDVLP